MVRGRGLLGAILLGLVTGLLTGKTAAAAGEVRQVVLVQNSGWMEPFYVDSGSQFKPLVAALAKTAAGANEQVQVLAFNQSLPGNPSPKRVYQGIAGDPGTRNALDAAVDGITLAKKPGSVALADTDFQEAITKTITEFLKRDGGIDEGILWIVTNNKNSPNNSPDTVKRNKEFYALVHTEPSITRSIAFPLAMPVKGKLYSANGLMIYALAYGEAAGQRLDQMLASGQIARLLLEPPARLKPLDRDSVAIVPKGVDASATVQVLRAADGRGIWLDVDASNTQSQASIKAGLKNLFSPFAIDDATVSAKIHAPRIGWDAPLTVSPNKLDDLDPGAEQDVVAGFPIPLAQIPGTWSAQSFSAMGKHYLIPAEIQLSLSNQSLKLSDAFRQKFASIFPGDPLPDVFVPPESIKGSTVAIPLTIRIKYPLTPVLAVAGLVLAALAGLVAAMALLGKSKRYAIVVDGQARNVTIPARGSVEVRSMTGEVVGRVSRGLGGAQVAEVAPGHTIQIKS